MKLAEALRLRADAQTRLNQLQQRLARSVRVQEGSAPPEDPAELLAEIERVLVQFTDMVKRINRTNLQTHLDDGRTLTDALAERDALALERNTLTNVIAVATTVDYRITRTEIRYVATVDVGALQRRVDDVARRYRELDTAIQTLNWTTELLD